MNVSLFGSTGFVGSYLLDALCEHNHHPQALVRPSSESKLRHADKCTIVHGSLSDKQSIRKTLDGADCVIYNIGILREFPKQGITFEALQLQGVKDVIEAAVQCGVNRFILMSANGVKPDGTEYQRTKYAAEQAVKDSGLAWTIFRPSVIFGDPRGKMEFATQLNAQLISPPLPAPLFYSGIFPINAGSYAMSPAHVRNVAQAFVSALHDSSTIGKTITLGGPNNISWKSIINVIAASQNKKKLSVPVPASVISLVAGLMQRFSWFPITRDQVEMLLSGNTCDASGFESLGINPHSFNEKSLDYLNKAN